MADKYYDMGAMQAFYDKIKTLFQTVANKVTSWSSTPSDDKYPSEKLVKTSLDSKLSTSDIDSELSATSTNPVQNKELTRWHNIIIGEDGYVSGSAANPQLSLQKSKLGALSVYNKGVNIKIYTYDEGDETNATLVFDIAEASDAIKNDYYKGKNTSTLYQSEAGKYVKIVYTGTTSSYFRALGVFMDTHDTSSTVSNFYGHLRVAGVDYPESANFSTWGSLVTVAFSKTSTTTAEFILRPKSSTCKCRIFGFRCLNTYTGDDAVLIGTASSAFTLAETLPISKGGTGQTTAETAANALLSGLSTWAADPSDNTKLIRRDNNGNAQFGQVTFSTVWNYIKSKISSVLGLSESGYTGNAATATAAAAASAAVVGSALETAINSKANESESVYYVIGSSDYVAYSASSTYTATTSSGPFTSENSCTYGGKAYFCKTAITTPEAWTSAHWTAIATPVLTGTIDGLTSLYAGLKIAYKMPITGGSSSTYLNINNLGNKYIRRNDSNLTTHLPANTVVFLAYDGTYWRWADYDSNTNNWVTTMGAYCETAAATQAKTATSTNTVYTAGEAFLIRIVNANTYNGKITLNINSQGAKDVWINGAISSSSNKTLPAGEHWCYYDGSVFHIWTDGTAEFKKIKAEGFIGDLSGTATSAAGYTNDGAIKTALDDKVPSGRKVNGKALSADIILNAADVSAIATSARGANNGVASLGADGKVPTGQLPALQSLTAGTDLKIADNVISVNTDGTIGNSAEMSFIAGSGTYASGVGAVAFGHGTVASGIGSHAEGEYTCVVGDNSHAEGYSALASATGAHAEGSETSAIGNNSHAEGASTKAVGNYSHAGGYSTYTSGNVGFVHGDGASAIYTNWPDTSAVSAAGQGGQVAFGLHTVAVTEPYTWRLGEETWVIHDEAARNNVTGYTASQSIFGVDIADDSNYGYILPGTRNIHDSGPCQEAGWTWGGQAAFGIYTTAMGRASFVAGKGNYAAAPYTFVAGKGNLGCAFGQTIVGTYADINNTDNMFVVGIGKPGNANRKNGFVVNNDGDAYIAGSASINSDVSSCLTIGNYNKTNSAGNVLKINFGNFAAKDPCLSSTSGRVGIDFIGKNGSTPCTGSMSFTYYNTPERWGQTAAALPSDSQVAGWFDFTCLDTSKEPTAWKNTESACGLKTDTISAGYLFGFLNDNYNVGFSGVTTVATPVMTARNYYDMYSGTNALWYVNIPPRSRAIVVPSITITKPSNATGQMTYLVGLTNDSSTKSASGGNATTANCKFLNGQSHKIVYNVAAATGWQSESTFTPMLLYKNSTSSSVSAKIRVFKDNTIGCQAKFNDMQYMIF